MYASLVCRTLPKRSRSAHTSTRDPLWMNANLIKDEECAMFLSDFVSVVRTALKLTTFKVVSVGNRGQVYDLSSSGIWSVAQLLQSKAPLEIVRDRIREGAPMFEEDITNMMLNSFENTADMQVSDNRMKLNKKTHLVSPHDLSALKACGVVFIKSLLERVVEEQAVGNPDKANVIRKDLIKSIGTDLDAVRPGSPQALELLRILTEERGISRHYLEVGLGKDAEVFTKGQAMSSVGFGAMIGVHPNSSWNNPEPELVLVINRFGDIIGVTLGNDVNLRDFEGRSALLLGKAKDNNGSCALGPLIRLFDEDFSLDDVRKSTINLSIKGEDGFILNGGSSMKEIGRDLIELRSTMFAPVEDRDPANQPGQGFTHKKGDEVVISSEKIGALVNYVGYTNEIPAWDFGVCDLFHSMNRE